MGEVGPFAGWPGQDYLPRFLHTTIARKRHIMVVGRPSAVDSHNGWSRRRIMSAGVTMRGDTMRMKRAATELRLLEVGP
jgi:hypothetical protein